MRRRALTPSVTIDEGTIPGGGRFSIVAVNGRAMTAGVETASDAYVVGERPNGTPYVQRIDRDLIAHLCADASTAHAASRTVRRAQGDTRDVAAAATSASVIRLAVFYPRSALADFQDDGQTNEARAAARLREHIENALALINAMFVASRVDAIVVLAGIEQLDVPLGRTLVDDVNMMNVSPLIAAHRNALRAHLAMLVRSGGEWDGFAGVLREPTTPAELTQAREHGAFAAVQTTCIHTGFMCFVHEFAHLVGAQHDRANADGPGFFADSYGHWWDGDDGVCHADVMSYECIGNRELVLAGSDVRDHGTRTGDAQNDNARGVRAGVRIVAGYR